MVDLEVQEWNGVQQGLIVASGACLQDTDVNQDLAANLETKAEAYGGKHDKLDFGSCRGSIVDNIYKCSWRV